jgi:hypothetical protein
VRSLIAFVLLLLAACTTITVQTSTGQGVVSHEADKGIIIKPTKTEETK